MSGTVGRMVLFLGLTINVDLVIFAGVLFGICWRRIAEVPPRPHGQDSEVAPTHPTIG
jgi:hypothetical protein